MADPFAAGLRVLFRGPRSVAAVYQRIGAQPLPIRVIRHQPTEDIQFGDTVVPVGTTIVEIDRSDVADPAAGDVLTLGLEILEIEGQPRLDRQGLKWLCEAPPARAF
jgi:hypothetical protein